MARADILHEHAAALELYAAQWTRAPEDCVQEAFIELVRQENPPRNVVGWLYRVVRNRALNAGRGERRRERHEFRAFSDSRLRLESKESPDVAEAERITQCLARLEADHREVLVLRIWSGLTLEEIAALLACSPSTVHRRYHAALEELRKLLEVSECPATTRCP